MKDKTYIGNTQIEATMYCRFWIKFGPRFVDWNESKVKLQWNTPNLKPMSHLALVSVFVNNLGAGGAGSLEKQVFLRVWQGCNMNGVLLTTIQKSKFQTRLKITRDMARL